MIHPKYLASLGGEPRGPNSPADTLYCTWTLGWVPVDVGNWKPPECPVSPATLVRPLPMGTLQPGQGVASAKPWDEDTGYQPCLCYTPQTHACPSPPGPSGELPLRRTLPGQTCLGSSLRAQHSVDRGNPAWVCAQPCEVSCDVAHASHFTDEKAEAGRGAGTHLRSPSWSGAGLGCHPAQSGCKAGSLVPTSQAP